MLHIKMLRDLRRLCPQVLAIALVMAAGTATLLIGRGSYSSLAETRSAYYERNRFADVFASLTRAPNVYADEIAKIPGVAAVETRISKIALIDIADTAEPIAAALVSIPDHREQLLNLLQLRSGRMPTVGDPRETVVGERFAAAHGLAAGSTFHAILNGRKQLLQVVGTALSPEFIYAVGPGQLMPDDRRFGNIWMSEKALAATYDLTGAFSDVALRLMHGTSEAAVIERLDDILARYGGRGAYGRTSQTSHAFLDAELKQLETMSLILPPIFLLVAAFLVNMTLSRLIALEREQIGLLKAIGYSNVAVAQHYLEFVLVIAVVGSIIGLAAGTWLGQALTRLYSEFFYFPFLLFRTEPAVYLVAIGITLSAAVVGALKSTRDAIRLAPAAAMVPPAPARYHRGFERFLASGVQLSQTTVMEIRHLIHWPIRSLLSALGVAFAVAILIGSLWSFGSIDLMIDITFHRSERQSATINFSQERDISAVADVLHLPGVLAAEPYRAIPVRIRHGHRERRVALTAKPPNPDLSRVLDMQSRPAQLPRQGIAVSDALADILKIKTDDIVELELLEQNRRVIEIPVAEIIKGYLGLGAYMELDAANAMIREGPRISGVHIAFDPLQRDTLFAKLKSTPVASFIILQADTLAKFRETIAQNIFIMIGVLVAFAGIIAFGVVYNFVRISLSEQGRELASLRVLGYTKNEVFGILLTELVLVSLLALPAGWLIGLAIAHAMSWGYASELYRVPFVVERSVYGIASLVVVGSVALSALVVKRRINRLDLIEVLKTRE